MPHKLRSVQAVVFCLLCSAAAAQQGDHDEDFERGLGRFTVASWRTEPVGQVTEAAARGGKRGVELVGSAEKDAVTVLWLKKPAFRLLAGEKYAASVWVKTANATGVELRIVMPEGVGIRGLKTRRLTGTNDWTKLEQTFTVSKKAQPEHLAVWMTGPGKAWVDDFRLTGRTGAEWQQVAKVSALGLNSTQELDSRLKDIGAKVGGFVDWYAGRFPSIAFIGGGEASGAYSEKLEFFHEKPFRYYNQVLDFTMENGGKVFGIRSKVRRYKEGRKRAPMRSFVLLLRCDRLRKTHHPSYILANGRRVWDAKKHGLWKGRYLVVPFSVEEPDNLTVDFVVNRNHTPGVKGLAFRLFYLRYLGETGTKIDLEGAATKAEGSPADKLTRSPFGLFPTTYDFWTKNGVTFAWIKKNWKPNFRPSYPVDDVYLCPFVFPRYTRSKYHDFAVTYGGCNLLGNKCDPQMAKSLSARLRGVMSSKKEPGDAQTVFGYAPHFKAVWSNGEQGVGGTANQQRHDARMEKGRKAMAAAKRATGQPDRVVAIYEPFSPALTCAHEYERGHDIVVLKNEEGPQYNIMMSMARGAGRTFGKPFGFYWEQTHYPYPSVDFKLHACLLFYLCGGSFIGSENDNAPSFASEVVADWVYPLIQAQRFAMVHPARGKPVVPIGIVWGLGDRWIVPYNPFGHLDTFLRYFDYDHATRKITTRHVVEGVAPWVPKNRRLWNFPTTGHMAYLHDQAPVLRGYDLLDVFFPKYGDAFNARIARLLTGTPYGPVDFVYANKAPVEHLKRFGLLAVLGGARITPEVEKKLITAAEAGVAVVVGVQHFQGPRGRLRKAFGSSLTFQAAAAADGAIIGLPAIYPGKAGKFSGKAYGFKGDDWMTVASAGDRPLVVSRKLGKGAVYVYLGELIHQGGAALRPLLKRLGETVAPLGFSPADDQMEYVAYRKGAGAWVALFNHGNIAVGCDRLKEPRATPPEPLVSQIKGPYTGRIEFRLARLGLDPNAEFVLYEVDGIDGKAFEGVISGRKTFRVKEVTSEQEGGVLKADVRFDKRAQYLIAPKGQGKGVFFGPGAAETVNDPAAVHALRDGRRHEAIRDIPEERTEP